MPLMEHVVREHWVNSLTTIKEYTINTALIRGVGGVQILVTDVAAMITFSLSCLMPLVFIYFL